MIQIAEHLFRPSEIGVVDRIERDAAGPVRRISCCGLVRPAWMGGSPRERIDLLAATLLVSTDPIPLSIRPGRRLWARARRLVRELRPEGAAFRLELDAVHPWEEDRDPTEILWSVSAWGETLAVDVPGTAPAPFCFELTARDSLETPALSDGTRTIRWMGAMAAGDRLELDGAARTARLNGIPADALLVGDWPQAGPGNTTLRFEDDVDGSHCADIRIQWRNRWW